MNSVRTDRVGAARPAAPRPRARVLCTARTLSDASAGWLQRLFVPRAARLQGTHVLTVEAATAPSNYIYENLAISPWSRTARVALSNAIVVVLLITSLVVVILLKSYQNTLLVRPAVLTSPMHLSHAPVPYTCVLHSGRGDQQARCTGARFLQSCAEARRRRPAVLHARRRRGAVRTEMQRLAQASD